MHLHLFVNNLIIWCIHQRPKGQEKISTMRNGNSFCSYSNFFVEFMWYSCPYGIFTVIYDFCQAVNAWLHIENIFFKKVCSCVLYWFSCKTDVRGCFANRMLWITECAHYCCILLCVCLHKKDVVWFDLASQKKYVTESIRDSLAVDYSRPKWRNWDGHFHFWFLSHMIYWGGQHTVLSPHYSRKLWHFWQTQMNSMDGVT